MRKKDLNKTISFKVEHLDPMGQGVFKDEEKIFFIPKVLPHESGTAKILKKKKGVHFAELLTLDHRSEQRIEPPCPHFDQCNGCHYLHTSYEHELKHKEHAIRRILQPLNIQKEIRAISADQRLGYRNRIQLHYNTKRKLLGFKKWQSNHIISVPNCLVSNDIVKFKAQELYHQNSWTKLVNQDEGHIEIYVKDGECSLSIDQNYAHQGFTQVNYEMNQKMLQMVFDNTLKLQPKNCLDLFGGNGNLSHHLAKEGCQVDVVDIYVDNQKNTENQSFHHLNLFEEDIESVIAEKEYDLLILDPPRSGFKGLAELCRKINFKHILYISCHPPPWLGTLKKYLISTRLLMSVL
jgi:23S rRNA (uracil1939-C5)-methyltransferase